LQAASGRSPSQGVAVPIPEADGGSRRLLFRYLPTTDGFISAPTLVNLGAAPIDATLSFYNSAGELVRRDVESLRGLPPLRPFAAVANDLAGEGENLCLIVESHGGPIAGVAFVFNQGREPAIGGAVAID